MYGDKNTSEANGFHSTVTVGPLQYIFHIYLESFEKVEICNQYPDFLEWCTSKVIDAKNNPISDTTLVQLGLKNDNS